MIFAAKFPMKFICATCHQIYLFRFKNEVVFCPSCPNCTGSGKLLGFATRFDLIRDPKAFIRSYLF